MNSRVGITLFLPAHNEAENLPSVVGKAVAFLKSRGCPFEVIIVNDGSTDNTFDVAQKLHQLYPQVRLVQHEVNKGYGAALRTGLQAGLDTGYAWVGFCDADGQFDPAQLGELIDEAAAEHADMAIGYRIRRADNLKRRLMGKGWHVVSQRVLGYQARDVDCGFKLFSHNALSILVPQLSGEHATISPEILTRAHRAGLKVVEVGVNHYVRDHGTQSGASPRVVYQSFRDLYIVHRSMKAA